MTSRLLHYSYYFRLFLHLLLWANFSIVANEYSNAARILLLYKLVNSSSSTLIFLPFNASCMQFNKTFSILLHSRCGLFASENFPFSQTSSIFVMIMLMIGLDSLVLQKVAHEVCFHVVNLRVLILNSYSYSLLNIFLLN